MSAVNHLLIPFYWAQCLKLLWAAETAIVKTGNQLLCALYTNGHSIGNACGVGGVGGETPSVWICVVLAGIQTLPGAAWGVHHPTHVSWTGR